MRDDSSSGFASLVSDTKAKLTGARAQLCGYRNLLQQFAASANNGSAVDALSRKGFMRRVRRLVRNHATMWRADSRTCKTIIGWKSENEYRSSVQTNQPVPLVLGLRLNRTNPAASNDNKVVNHRPWKLLQCPYTGVISQRDLSAAWAIALCNGYANNNKKKRPAGYTRG